jgi:predicted RNA-binding protein YlxR (DUF448 family)
MGRQPERACVGCRTRRGKSELVRVARGDGRPRVDPTGTAPGRGAYVCRDPACAVLATRKGALGRALRAPLAPADLARLREEIEKEIEAR